MVSTPINHQIKEIVEDLTEEFGENVGSTQIQDQVSRVFDRLTTAPIQPFVPVLTRKIAREELLRRTAA